MPPKEERGMKNIDPPVFAAALREVIAELTPTESLVKVGERWPVIRTGKRPPVNRMMRRLIYQRDGYTCGFCFKRGLMQLDHIIPWSAGGSDRSDNLRSLCKKCNEERSNYRTESDHSAVPVTLACDVCIDGWIRKYGYSTYGRCIPGAPAVTAFCGNCQSPSYVTDPRRLK
jgi:hypothetical protein